MGDPNFRPVILAVREHLQAGREKLWAQHASGSPGIQVSSHLTDLLDRAVLDVYRAAMAEVGGRRLEALTALVALGGYGRRDVAPYSDVDLMLLHASGAATQAQPLARRLTQDLCDAGLTLGFSLRSTSDACSLALADATILTSLAESRRLAGSEPLFAKFLDHLRRAARRRTRTLIDAIEESRHEERARYGETVFLLTPNIKRSWGGLRDLQLVRWVGFARFGEADLRTLERLGVLSPDDYRQLHKAHEFLLRLRNELHFHAGKAQDVLDRDEQVRIAELFQYRARQGLIPAEEFMRDYFQHTSNVRDSAQHFVEAARSRTGLVRVLHRLASHNVEGDFRVGPAHIGASRRGLDKVRSDLGEVLRLMDLANLYNKPIDHSTWEAIRLSMIQRTNVELNREVISRFLSLLSQPGQMGGLLRRLHELRVLEKLVPGMQHARCLVQFNDYHKYTVDEHSLRAVEEAERLLAEPGPLGEAYRSIKNKRLVHLALLLHDLGKGYSEDHSEVGARLAAENARLLGLPPHEAETLQFLIAHHLFLSNTAQFRDIHDPDVIVEAAVLVGSPEVLQMLYVLTCADLAAVGPGVLSSWKLDLLTQFYESVQRELTGEVLGGSSSQQCRLQRDNLLARVQGREPVRWWAEQIEALPPAYLFGSRAERVLQDLDRLQPLERREAVAWGLYLPETEAVEYTVGTHEEITPGIFHKLTGVLSSQRMQILSADINTLADGLVLDRFYVQDPDFEGEPPPSRLQDISGRLVAVLKTPSYAPPTFPQIWGARGPQAGSKVPVPPTQVRVDNSTSDRFTILDIFALDRRALLYTITRKLFELSLSVHMAKIGTRLDQVVDVFYVTDMQDHKVVDEPRVDAIRTSLLEEIERFEASQ
jgi:[protein-PII] uridylyltransferase